MSLSGFSAPASTSVLAASAVKSGACPSPARVPRGFLGVLSRLPLGRPLVLLFSETGCAVSTAPVAVTGVRTSVPSVFVFRPESGCGSAGSLSNIAITLRLDSVSLIMIIFFIGARPSSGTHRCWFLCRTSHGAVRRFALDRPVGTFSS